jgi:hypothetical protein
VYRIWQLLPRLEDYGQRMHPSLVMFVVLDFFAKSRHLVIDVVVTTVYRSNII